MACPSCSWAASVGQHECAACGAALQQPCSACGAAVPAGQAYCGACGTPRDAAGAALAPAGPAAGGHGIAPLAIPNYPPNLFGMLLIGLVVRFALPPLVVRVVDPRLLLDSALIVALTVVVRLIDRRPLLWRLLGIVGALLIVVNVLLDVRSDEALGLVQRVLSLGFFSAVTLAMVRCVLRRERVTLDKIYGAVCAYILLAFTWGMTYDLLELLQPGSFVIPEAASTATEWGSVRRAELVELIYFSFMTITSVGYSDIQVQSDNARTLLMIESVVGQIYPVVLIARLVNLQVTHAMTLPPLSGRATGGDRGSGKRLQHLEAATVQRVRRVAARDKGPVD